MPRKYSTAVTTVTILGIYVVAPSPEGLSTSPPVSPSPYEVSKERGKKKKEGLPPLLDAPGKTMDNRFSALAVVYY